MAGLSSRAKAASPENNRKYNGIEYSFGLDICIYEAFYRHLDPQIGRFLQIDPYFEQLSNSSPYESMGNDPINKVDPLGDFRTKFGAWIHKIFHGGGEIGQNRFGEWFVRKSQTSHSSVGGPTVTVQIAYGEGRRRHTAKLERLLDGLKEEQVIDDFTRLGIWDPNLSEEEAKRNTLGLGVNLVQPSALIRPLTISTNVKAAALKLKIIFGNNENQVYHTFRHIEELGLSRDIVQKAIEEHLPKIAHQIQQGKALNQIIEVAGKELQYTAFMLSDGTINVGRIHGIN